METKDIKYMRRALQLAARGYGFASPNPMVGAVITTPDGLIIGEGWHRCWGGPHAEVNAVASVRDKSLLPGSTVYVTLEPCAHYGKTPPCASLLIESRVGRVVIGSEDPFAKVHGRGISMLREAGIEVVVGVLEQECKALNTRFMYAHSHQRPYVALKWAESSDGYVAHTDGSPATISTPISQVLMHRYRAGFDAIMVGTGTLNNDNPSLTCRLWPSRMLRPVVYDPHGHVSPKSRVLSYPHTIVIGREMELPELLHELYTTHGITSLLVEGGPTLIRSFMEQGLYQQIRVEQAATPMGSGIPAPAVPSQLPVQAEACDGAHIYYYQG